MLDVTSTNQSSTIASVRRVDPAANNPAAAEGGGQDAPVRGTNLPVEAEPKPELVELPELERLAEIQRLEVELWRVEVFLVEDQVKLNQDLMQE